MVLTQKGNKGVVIGEAPLAGKVTIVLLNDKLEVMLDAHGNYKKLMCDPAKIKIIGYYN